jgi:hypothetical protein
MEPDSVYVLRFPSLLLLNIYPRIRVRRIRDPDDRTTVLDESEEYFNSDDELDSSEYSLANYSR